MNTRSDCIENQQWNLKIHWSLKAHNFSYNPNIKNLFQGTIPHILYNMIQLSIVCCDVLSVRRINPFLFLLFLHVHPILCPCHSHLCPSLPSIHAKDYCSCDLQSQNKKMGYHQPNVLPATCKYDFIYILTYLTKRTMASASKYCIPNIICI